MVGEAILLLLSTIIKSISSLLGTKIVNSYEKGRGVGGLQRMTLHLYTSKELL